jgi:AraC-like DNA-binding protein
MTIQLNIEVVVLAIIIILALTSALILLFRKENRYPNKLLSLFIISIALWLVDAFLRVSGIYSQNPNAYFKPIYFSFAFGPLLYFYVKSLTRSNYRLRGLDFLHFVPVACQFGLYLFLNFQDYVFKRNYWLEVHEPITYRIEFDGTFISLALYCFLAFIMTKRYQNSLQENYSNQDQIRLNWLVTILLLMIMICIQWFIEVILRDFYHSYYEFNYSIFLLGLLTLFLAMVSLYQSDLNHIDFVQRDHSITQFDSKLSQLIVDKMESEKLYLDPDLNLKTLSASCNLPSRTVSQHINQDLNKTFHDFVNHYRIEDVKHKLNEGLFENYTILSIAFDCGFNSKASFNRVFKQQTGVTPSEYISTIYRS